MKLLFFFVLLLVILICSNDSGCNAIEIEHEQSTFSLSRTPTSVNFVCNNLNGFVSQHYRINFTSSSSSFPIDAHTLLQQKMMMTRLAVDFSHFDSGFTVTSVSSNKLYCLVNLQSNHLVCTGKGTLNDFIVDYTLSLSCNNYCTSSSNTNANANNDRIFSTLIRIKQNKLVVKTTESDTLKCKCVMPPSPPVCDSCRIKKVLKDIVAGDKLVLQSDINAYSFDGSCCDVFNSTAHETGQICKNFPQHWIVHKSENREDIGELSFTFPTSGDFTLHCCSDENKFEDTNVLGPMMGRLNFYLIHKTPLKQQQELFAVWECPMLPPSNITSVDTVYINCNSCSCFVQDLASSFSLYTCEAALHAVHNVKLLSTLSTTLCTATFRLATLPRCVLETCLTATSLPQN